MEFIRTDDSTVSSILALTENIIQKRGTRAPGSKGAAGASDDLKEYIGQFCGSVRKEAFAMHPDALFSTGRIVGAIYLLSMLLLFFGGVFCYISACLGIIALIYALVHFFLYGKLFDVFFKKEKGYNVVGTIEPSGEVEKQVIVSGHHDSAYVFSFFLRFKKLAGIRLILAIAFFTFIVFISVARSIEMIFTGTVWSLSGASLVLTLIGLLFIVPAINFISTKVSPGAGDNLNGSSIAIHTGRFFAEKSGNAALQNTRLIILSTDGEEAGQRGATSYVKHHKNELMSIPTYVINVDSIYQLKELAVMLRDIHGFVPLSKPLGEICLDTASRLGYSPKSVSFPFGSGTDAASFAKAGIEATSIIAMSTSLSGQGHTYHTPNDIVENIKPEAVRAVFDILVNTIIRIDREL